MSAWLKFSRTVSVLAFAFWLPTMPLPMEGLPHEQKITPPCRASVDAGNALNTKADRLSKIVYVTAMQISAACRCEAQAIGPKRSMLRSGRQDACAPGALE